MKNFKKGFCTFVFGSYIIITAAVLSPLFASYNDRTPFERYEPPKVNIRVGYEYQNWIPYKSDKLDYNIRKNQIGYFDTTLFPGSFTRSLEFLPNLRFHWETNFNGHTQSELMTQSDSSSPTKYAYNKLRSSIDFFKCKEDTQNPVGWVQVEYTQERFFCSVTPVVSDLYYQPFNGSLRSFAAGSVVSQYVNFHEVSLTFNTCGFEVLLGIMTALSSGDNSDMKILDLTGVADTRLGFFFAQFHKPYELDQYTGSSSSGGENIIYNARFRTVGLIEKVQFKPFRIFYLGYNPRFGLTFIDLKKGTALQDSDAPLFFYYAHELEMGLKIGTDRYAVRIIGSFDYSFMLGGTMKTNEDTGDAQIETSSFINDDILIKLYATTDLWF